jgi:hypothetical protein
VQVAAAEEQLKRAQDSVEEATGPGRTSAATPIPPEELERRKRVLKRSEEELARRTAELDRCTAELAARRITMNKLIDLQKEREARLERLQSQGSASANVDVGAKASEVQLRNSCTDRSILEAHGISTY